MSFFLGLDLGQSQDYTALTVVRHEPRAYHVVHLERYPLGTLYPEIVEHVATLIASLDKIPPARADGKSTKRSELVLDATGVGRPVTDMFRESLGNGTVLRPVIIHGGEKETRKGGFSRVPKRELVSRSVALMQKGELRIARGMALTPTLVEELTNFKIKVNISTGRDSYEAWREGDHDDLVLAVCLAVWGASRPPRPKVRVVSVDRRDGK